MRPMHGPCGCWQLRGRRRESSRSLGGGGPTLLLHPDGRLASRKQGNEGCVGKVAVHFCNPGLCRAGGHVLGAGVHHGRFQGLPGSLHSQRVRRLSDCTWKFEHTWTPYAAL